ncbi:hypothetical protein E5345_00175 [Propionibacterium sp. NM47_B9-13]|nr:hypothetical protein HMPREF9621_02061 [Cutibacterium modestum HL037PA2]EFS90945.1 hypothetical protein HMPREF9607_02784 [Cutibacterium modestum HL044PA1]EFT14855.1 hypothetical protein HMPREF9622_02105 [Cutibacterium modestum HL037PA3]REB73356.1 hypothetical protein CP877_07060 [Cutibacterium modestum]TGY29755.1 hypothetical protein E5345_00175 [Propionibacterium sp. NM47_B9-13]
MLMTSPSLFPRRVGVLGRGLLLPRVVPHGTRRGTGRIRTGRGIIAGRLLMSGRILTRTIMVRPGVVVLVRIMVVRPVLVMVVLAGMLSGVGMMLAGMFMRVAG